MTFTMATCYTRQICKQILTSPRMKRNITGYMATRNLNYETLKVSQPAEYVCHVEVNRPEKLNTMTLQFMSDIKTCFDTLSTDSSCRSIVLSAAGRLFTAGIDLPTLMNLGQSGDSDDVGRKGFMIRNFIRNFQESFTAIEKCPKPVIAAVHNACIGGGVDMISACDIRYCSQDAYFQIKEIDVGLAADLGTIQRFPKVVGNDSLARELIYTARKFLADEAKEIGFVSKICSDKESTVEAAIETASVIAGKSPIAVQGSKISAVYARDHPVSDSLNQIATWNLSMLQSEDGAKAAVAFMEKSTPTYSKL